MAGPLPVRMVCRGTGGLRARARGPSRAPVSQLWIREVTLPLPSASTECRPPAARAGVSSFIPNADAGKLRPRGGRGLGHSPALSRCRAWPPTPLLPLGPQATVSEVLPLGRGGRGRVGIMLFFSLRSPAEPRGGWAPGLTQNHLSSPTPGGAAPTGAQGDPWVCWRVRAGKSEIDLCSPAQPPWVARSHLGLSYFISVFGQEIGEKLLYFLRPREGIQGRARSNLNWHFPREREDYPMNCEKMASLPLA